VSREMIVEMTYEHPRIDTGHLGPMSTRKVSKMQPPEHPDQTICTTPLGTFSSPSQLDGGGKQATDLVVVEFLDGVCTSGLRFCGSFTRTLVKSCA